MGAKDDELTGSYTSIALLFTDAWRKCLGAFQVLFKDKPFEGFCWSLDGKNPRGPSLMKEGLGHGFGPPT